MNWQRGNVTVNPGVTITNNGAFLMDSGASNTFGNDVGAAKTNWTFQNNRRLYTGAGKAQKMDTQGKGKEFKVKTASAGPDVFDIQGTYTQAVASATTDVQSGTLEVDGAVTLSAGDTTVEAGTTFDVSGDDVTMSGGTMEVAGAVDTDSSFLEQGGTLTLEDGALSAAAGLSVQAGATLTGTGSATAAVTTAGQVTVGWVESQNGDTLTVTGPYTQSGGDTTVPQGATLDVSGGDVTLSAGTMEVSGTLTGTNNFQQNAGTVTVGPSGALTATAEYTENSGTLAMQGGTVTSGLPLLVEPQAQLSGRGTVDASLDNYGLVLVGQGGTGTLAVTYYYTQISGNTALGTPGQDTQAVLSVGEAMDVQGGGVALNNDNDAVATGGLTIEQGATLVGTGIISANVTNAGSITIPGSGTVQTLTINGSYTQTATGTLSLTLSGATSDPLTVNGQVSLAGSLDVGYADGFTLHPGQNFALINCGSSLSGSFGTVDLPSGTDLQYPTPPSGGEIFLQMPT